MAQFIIGEYIYETYPSSQYKRVSVKVLDASKSSYEDIPQNVIYQGDTYYVTDATNCFRGCTSLTQAPVIPDSVTDMGYCFVGCTSLTTAPVIPNDVIDMGYCFVGCTSLTTAPVIPNDVIDMGYCFWNCESLIQAPEMPNGVTNMEYCFAGCYSLLQAPEIPSTITNLYSCFWGCTSLTQAPVIPDSVTDIRSCFYRCTSLVGDVYILGNPLTDGAFKDTILPITVHTFNQTVADSSKLSANNNNVTIQTKSSQGDVPITILGTRTLTKEENITYGTDVGIRIDLLANCTDGVALTNVYINNVPHSNVLYDMDNNLIPLNSESAPLYIPPDYLRCYIIINAPQIVPDKRLNLFIKKVAFMKTNAEDKRVAYPSTATPSQVKQEGQGNLISPQIDIFNISFNPETTRLNEYTIGSLIGVARLDMIRAQTNNLHNLYPIKHIVTHANNVKVSDTQTLQDWITEQYSEFL